MYWFVIEFSSVEYWPGKQLVHREFAFNVLYLPGAHPVHVPLFWRVVFVNPLLHVQALDDMVPAGEFEFEWQSEHALYTSNSSKPIIVDNESVLETMKIHWPDNWQLYFWVTFESSLEHWVASSELLIGPILTTASWISLLQQMSWWLWSMIYLICRVLSKSRIQYHWTPVLYRCARNYRFV